MEFRAGLEYCPEVQTRRNDEDLLADRRFLSVRVA